MLVYDFVLALLAQRQKINQSGHSYYNADMRDSKSPLFVLDRGSDEKKEKGGDKTPEHQNSGEHEASGKTPKLAHMELNRGTAV